MTSATGMTGVTGATNVTGHTGAWGMLLNHGKSGFEGQYF